MDRSENELSGHLWNCSPSRYSMGVYLSSKLLHKLLERLWKL